MKSPVAIACISALLFLTSCRPSPEKLLATANKYHQNKQYKEASILYQKVISKDKKNAEAYYREGLNLLDQGNPSDAAQYLRRAIDLNPANMDAESKLAEIFLTAYMSNPKRFKQAVPEIEDLKNKIQKRDPNAYEALRLQALLDLVNQNPTEALDLFAKANKVRPYSRDLVGWYAQALMRTGHAEQAEALVRDMITHDKTWGPGYDFLFVYYEQSKDQQKAEAILRQRMANDPTSTVAITNVASFLASTGRVDEGESVIKRVLSDKKAFPNGHEIVGTFYQREKKFDQAIQEFQTGAQEDSARALDYNHRIVATYAAMGRRDDARNLAKSLAEKNPKDTISNEMYASLLLETGSGADAAKSVNELQTLVKNNSSNAMLHLDLGRAYLNTGDANKALSETNEAIQDEGKAAAPRPGVILPARLILARIYEARGQHAQTLEQCNQVLQVQQTNPEARLLKDQALVGLNEADQATPDLQALIQQYPRLNDARMALGGIYLSQHKYTEANDQFQSVWTGNPPDSRGYFGMQEVKLVQGKVDDAIKGMQELTDKYPQVPTYRFQLADFQTTGGRVSFQKNPEQAKNYFSAAMENLKIVAKSNPNAAAVWVKLGLLQQQLGQLDPALASFEQASKVEPNNPEPLLQRAMILDAQGKKNDARDLYNRVLGIDTNNAAALNNLAFLDAESGSNLDQAMTFAERAKKQAPQNPAISDTLGYVYLRKNLNAAALDIFRQNVQDQPQNPTFHLHLAMALLKNGDKQGAKDEAQKAIKIAPPNQQGPIQTFMNQIG